MKRMFFALLGMAAMVSIVGLGIWAVVASFQAQAFCLERGYAKGEAMVGGAVVCTEGKVFTGYSGEDDK